jgi:hypothetical protein
MNENESPNQRPFRRCLDTWPEEMGVEKEVDPISVPDALLKTTPALPYPWNGAFLKWQRNFKDEPH